MPNRTELTPLTEQASRGESGEPAAAQNGNTWLVPPLPVPSADLAGWMDSVEVASNTVSALREKERAGGGSGYRHTLREILQQPLTWRETGHAVQRAEAVLAALLGDGGPSSIRSVLLTGSGSSLYVGECVKRFLREQLQIPTDAVEGGDLLLSLSEAAAPRPRLMISIARSGDSPESVAAVERLLEAEPDSRHLVVTCNRQGRLALDYAGHPQVSALVLPDATCDRSLVMTSSFTSMAMACRGLGRLGRMNRFMEEAEAAAKVAEGVLLHDTDSLARLGAEGYSRAVFLGSRARYGAACEAALKMLEMTEGRVATLPESFLGLRHGPMSFLREDSLLVCFLSSVPSERAYELDLLGELDRKNLGARRIIVGAGLGERSFPRNGGGQSRFTVTWDERLPLGEDGEAILSVLVGQLLGFSRCMAEGLNPDAPSPAGVIGRVVEAFPIHRSQDAKDQ